MANLSPGKSFKVNSDAAMAADAFETLVVGASTWINAAESDRISFSVGLIDPNTGAPFNVVHIQDGIIDEYVLHADITSLPVTLKGRDPMGLLLNRYMRRRYARPARVETLSRLVNGEIVTGDTGLDNEPDDSDVEVRRGIFTAKAIAQDIAEVAGLTLAWTCRDYTMQEDFDANGRLYDLLKKLVEPWSQVEPFTVDIFVNGGTLYVRPRQLSPTADYTYSVLDARFSDLTLTKRAKRFYKIARVRLSGMKQTSGIVEVLDEMTGQGTGVFVNSNEDKEEVLTNTSFDEYGQVIERTVSKNLYRIPDRLLIRSEKQTIKAGVLLSKEIVENEWDPSVYDQGRAINSPVQRKQMVQTWGIAEGDKTKTFRMIKRTRVSYSYDSEKFMTGTTQVVEAFSLKQGQLLPSEMVVRTIRKSATLQTEQITDTYKAKKSSTAANPQWFLQTRDTQPGSGHPPGGPGRAAPVIAKGSAGDTTGGSIPIRLDADLSVDDPEALDLIYDNPHLSAGDLAFIMGQAEQANGAVRVEASWTAVAMPWLRQGIVLQLTNLEDADQSAIPLLPALITKVDTDYSESESASRCMMSVTAVYWITP